MKKHFCDECGKKINKMFYALNTYKIIGITGCVEKYIESRTLNDDLIAHEDCQVEFEVCSKRCMLQYLRKKVLK